MPTEIYDSKGNLIGYKTKMHPSGDTVVVYTQRLKDEADKRNAYSSSKRSKGTVPSNFGGF